jgi:hypothetical protein
MCQASTGTRRGLSVKGTSADFGNRCAICPSVHETLVRGTDIEWRNLVGVPPWGLPIGPCRPLVDQRAAELGQSDPTAPVDLRRGLSVQVARGGIEPPTYRFSGPRLTVP